MTENLDLKEAVNIKELVLANSIEVDALAELLIEKGIITEQEFFSKLKEVQAEYERKRRNS